MRLGPVELGLMLLLVLVVFGAGRLPEVFRNLRGPPDDLGPRVPTGTRTHENAKRRKDLP